MNININYKLSGGQPKSVTLEAGATVSDLLKALGLKNHAPVINGETGDANTVLSDEDFVILTEQTKGA